jgi:hypothetical protein
MKRADLRLLFPLRPQNPCASRCVYCSALCWGRACPEHRPLIQVDPNYGGVK